LVDAIDLSHIQTLYFWCEDRENALSLTFLPTQLTELYLKHIKITSESLANQAHCLPQLKVLTLENIHIEGALQLYLKSPKLEKLNLGMVRFSPLNRGNKHGDEGESSFSARLPHLTSLEGFSELEMLSLRDMPLDGLVQTIKSYSRLSRLSVDCGREGSSDFIPSFVEALVETKSFRSLARLDFYSKSWDSEQSISYNDFIGLCDSRRPHINIYRDVLFA
jgi:hypothetical protein